MSPWILIAILFTGGANPAVSEISVQDIFENQAACEAMVTPPRRSYDGSGEHWEMHCIKREDSEHASCGRVALTVDPYSTQHVRAHCVPDVEPGGEPIN